MEAMNTDFRRIGPYSQRLGISLSFAIYYWNLQWKIILNFMVFSCICNHSENEVLEEREPSNIYETIVRGRIDKRFEDLIFNLEVEINHHWHLIILFIVSFFFFGKKTSFI